MSLFSSLLWPAGRVALAALLVVLALPVVAVLASWWPGAGQEQAWAILREMASTVLWEYAQTTLALCAMVAVGVVMMGLGAAAAVTLWDFPGRRVFEWALLLPLAMPAYVVAYGYTDFFQFSGPFQIALREAFGWEGRVFPEVRSTWGAAWVFSFALYPYVYLLARTALNERGVHLMEAARLMGASLPRRLRQVAFPMARPAVAAGVALALMEVLADFGVSSYFGIQTFTAGVYKAWLAMDNRVAASQLATMLLTLVLVLLALEQHAQRRMRFGSLKGQRSGSQDAAMVRPGPWGCAVLIALCAVPVLAGFVAPVAFMLRPLWADTTDIPWARFADWAWNSVRLAGLTTTVGVLLALALAFQVRVDGGRFVRWGERLVGLGYAVPGAVIVVGVLLPVGWVQSTWPQAQMGYWVTATVLGLVWAYLVRFTAVALQSVQSGYSRVPRSLDESARLLGAGDARLLRTVHWPLLRRSVAAAALLVLVDVMKELPATLVLRPFNSDTLAVVAYQLARDERLGEAALPCLALVLVGLIPVVLLSRTLRTSEA